ncbi:MAG: hypothetical protein NVSMB46_03680 [Candidatus Saccharimonadales bacterium]
MSELSSVELFLNGKLQIATARDALTFSGINPEAVKMFSAILGIHETVSDSDEQNDLFIFYRGESAHKDKTDIVTGLELMIEKVTDNRSDAIEAARGLLSILIQK